MNTQQPGSEILSNAKWSWNSKEFSISALPFFYFRTVAFRHLPGSLRRPANWSSKDYSTVQPQRNGSTADLRVVHTNAGEVLSSRSGAEGRNGKATRSRGCACGTAGTLGEACCRDEHGIRQRRCASWLAPRQRTSSCNKHTSAARGTSVNISARSHIDGAGHGG